MQTMTIQKFESGAPQILKQVVQTGEEILITQDGKPIAKIIKFKSLQNIPGKLAHTVSFENDIVAPFGDQLWEACH